MSNKLELTPTSPELVQLPNFINPIKIINLKWQARSLSYRNTLQFLSSLSQDENSYSRNNSDEVLDINELMLICKNYPNRFNYENLTKEITSLVQNNRLNGDTNFELEKIQLTVGMDLYKEPEISVKPVLEEEKQN